MSLLPVATVLEPLLAALQSSPQVLLNAATGAGKSTWLPLQLLNIPCLRGKIMMLEPRRLAARSVAHRLAQQLGEPLGQTVGYRIRAESKVTENTRLEVVTEGILTRMLQQDPMLCGVALVILDEFHERTLQADLALALLLDIQQGLRDDLRLLIMSATLDNTRLEQLLPTAPVISAIGRSFPIIRQYLARSQHERLENAVAQAVLALLRKESGSLLAFLPGVGEIRRVLALLQEKVASDTDIFPLYGALSIAQQQQAIAPSVSGRRKVVLATNIAETSLTIDGIRLVVDSAMERTSQFDIRSGLTRLVTQRTSQASMAQRAGRAGRLMEGVCWHLISSEQRQRLAEHPEPEILHSDLSPLWLELLQWGCRDAAQLCWLDPPPQLGIAAAQRLLQQLGAVDQQGILTERGRAMGQAGCEPRLAAMLCAAQQADEDALATAALLAAIIEEPGYSHGVDMCDRLYHPQEHWQRRAFQLAKRLGKGTGIVRVEEAAFWLAHAYPDRIARSRAQDGRYLLANGLGAAMGADDPLSRWPWLIIVSLLQGVNQSETGILLALPCNIEPLIERLPMLVTEQVSVEWDKGKGTLSTIQRQQLGSLTLKTQVLTKPSITETRLALLNWIRLQGIEALGWDEASRQLRWRLHCAAQWLPDEKWPLVDDNSLLDSLEFWLQPSLEGVVSLKGLESINVSEALLRLLNGEGRQRLASALPTHYRVSSGAHVPIRYFSDKPPVLAVRIQEMFGERQNPRIARGRVTLVLELLSPARRPLQVTADLATFWQGAYREVKKEMKGRYPKHPWPDDPLKPL